MRIFGLLAVLALPTLFIVTPASAQDREDAADTSDEEDDEQPRRRRFLDDDFDEDDEEDDEAEQPRRKRKKAATADDEADDPPRKKRKVRQIDEDPELLADEEAADEEAADEEKPVRHFDIEEEKEKEPAQKSKLKAKPATAKVLSSEIRSERVALAMRASSQIGPIGLDQVWSADPGPQGTFRLKLSYGFFSADDFPVDGATNDFNRADLSLAWTPVEALEAFISLRSTSNVNDAGTPSLLQTQGDLTIGAKGGYFVTKDLAIGGAIVGHLISGLGEGGYLFDATSIDFRALITFDFTREMHIPLRLHLDTSFYLEGSEEVFADQPEEPSLIQEQGLQISRYDRLTIGLGIEAPISPYFAPFAEYRIGTPFLVELVRIGEGADRFDFASVPHNIAVGMHAFPLPNLAVDATFRYGLSDNPFTGVPATEPWMALLGISYTIDPRPEIEVHTVAPESPAPVEAPPAIPKGFIAGKIVDKTTNEPIANAHITYPMVEELTAQVADDLGRFRSYGFKAGRVKIRIVAQGYEARIHRVKVAQGKTTKATIKLKPDPATQTGRVEIRVFNAKGRPGTAGVRIGEQYGEIYSDRPFVGDFKAGTYQIEVGEKGYKTETKEIKVIGGETLSLRIPMKRGKGTRPGAGKGVKPPRIASSPAPTRSRAPKKVASGGSKSTSRVKIRGKSLRIKGKIAFKKGTAQLTGASKSLLGQVALVLKGNPKVQKIRVGSHTDNKGDPAALIRLSTERAQSVRSYLKKRGVSGSRITVKGYGPNKPIAPNLTARGRAKNERTTFTIIRMAK